MERHVLLREQRMKLVAGNLAKVFAPVRSVAEMCETARGGDDDGPHIVICPVCGRMLDCRDSAQVEHHESADHLPMLLRASKVKRGPS